jgi:hypothetical protein
MSDQTITVNDVERGILGTIYAFTIGGLQRVTTDADLATKRGAWGEQATAAWLAKPISLDAVPEPYLRAILGDSITPAIRALVIGGLIAETGECVHALPLGATLPDGRKMDILTWMEYDATQAEAPVVTIDYTILIDGIERLSAAFPAGSHYKLTAEGLRLVREIAGDGQTESADIRKMNCIGWDRKAEVTSGQKSPSRAGSGCRPGRGGGSCVALG